jgi:hypothetical protein
VLASYIHYASAELSGTHSSYTVPDSRDQRQDQEQNEEVKDLPIDLPLDSSALDRRIPGVSQAEANSRCIAHQFRFVAGIDNDPVYPFRVPKLSTTKEQLIRTDGDLGRRSSRHRG